MKKIFLFLFLAFFTQAVTAQTLFTYGKNTVTKAEFLRAYNKNKTVVTDKNLALREYLDLYIKFKLKVQAAKDLRIDTLPAIKQDVENFRTQVQETYLNDESSLNALIDEAYERSQKDVHVAYAFYPKEIYSDSISVLKAHKEAKVSWTDIGFITSFTLPYEFENIVYNLKPGEESKPFRVKIGYYIFKNIQERKAVGKITAAQILIALPENPNENERSKAAAVADSVYKLLQAGSDFGEMAKKISNDQMSYQSGGMMPEFGVGKYRPDFENKVFALQKDGDITIPFHTAFGYHIVKRISKSEIPSDKNDVYLYTLKQQVLQDSRISSAREKFLSNVLKKLNYKKNAAVKQQDLWRLADSFFVSNKNITTASANSNSILFWINNKSFKTTDWLSFIKNEKNHGSSSIDSYQALLDNFISTTALDIYKKRLPEFNPDFKYQLQEFKDGNMLFEVMERNVWSKASNDTKGLQEYYHKYKTNYTWNESADAVFISSSNQKLADDVIEQIKKGKSWKMIAEENPGNIQTDSGRYELSQIPAKPNTKFVEGMVTEPSVNENDGTATFVIILKLYPANLPRNFEEARGLVINDYQNYLEEKWIEQLKKKYPVTVNQKIFQSLL